MRMTTHNGRAGKDGVYSVKHNDRNFNTENSPHIDAERSSRNWYWHCYKKADPDMTFEEVEKRFYEEHFKEALEERNARAINARHPERVKTMDDYRRSTKTCPEEQILQIGQKGNTIAPVRFQHIVVEQLRWEEENFPNFKLLDVALHVDEEGAPHIHKRGVWVAHDECGREIVGQAKALAEMGIQSPDPEKKYGKYNNAKITYTKICRDHLAEICHEHGLDLELNPKERSKTGLALEEYKAQQEQEKVAQARETAQIVLKDVSDKEIELDAIKRQIEQAQEVLKATLNMKARASEIHRPFGDREIQTYHRNMLNSTRAIGDEAYERMKEASKTLLEIARREEILQKKEAAIEPLYAAARADRDQAQNYIDRQKEYIIGTAEKQAQKKFDDFIRQFDFVEKGRAGRLEEFCKGFTLNGRTLLEVFEQEERERQEYLKKEWDDYER